MRRLSSSLLFVVSLASCGKGGSAPAAPRGPDLSSPEAVWAQASKALEAGDLASLAPFLSEAGARQVRGDLEAWRSVLADRDTGPRTFARIPAAKTEGERADLERALAGDLASLLRVYVRADPHPAPAALAAPVPPRAPEATWAELEYGAHDGSRRRVVLTREAKEWRIVQIQL